VLCPYSHLAGFSFCGRTKYLAGAEIWVWEENVVEEEIGRIRKNESTEVVIRKTEFRGSVGVDIREYLTSERYTGWSKNGVRIPIELWEEFKAILDRVGTGDGGS